MKFYGIFREGSQVNQVLCAVLVNLPVLAYGASIGWMSPMTLLLQSEYSPKGVPLTDAEVSIMASAPYLACILFGLVMAYIGDKVGRKISLLLLSMALATSWILLLCSFETWTLVFARALVGVTMAGCFVTCPIYTKEISDDTIRGALGCLVVLFQTTGNLFLYIIGDLLSYRTILWVCLSLPTFHMIVFVFMPDSPSFLVKKGRIEEAKKALAWLHCRSIYDMKVQEEIDFIKKEQNKDKGAHPFLIKSIFTDKILLKAFQIAMVVTLAREVCGAIPVLNFAGEIFTLASKDSGLVLTPNQQAMLLGVVQVVGSILASSVVERCGRKPLLCVTSLVSGLSMCLLGSWFLLRDYEIQAPSWLPLMTLCVCIFCDASGLQPISIVLAGEIFSYKMVTVTLLVVILFSLVTKTMQRVRAKRLDLTPHGDGQTTCTTRNNMQGVCVDESACNADHTLMPGGVLEDTDFRQSYKKPCAGQTEWCCTSGVIPHPQIGATQSDKCLALENDVCPWCVLLYNVVDVKPTAHRPFCLGALIGSRVIITASTCLLAAQKKMLYAQVPNSANPGKNYTVIRRQLHPNYISGSHEYDFGIVVIENDVVFEKGKSRGACIDFQKPLEGDCLGYGFDDKGRITSTIMKVRKNSCSKNGSAKDAACGINEDNVCIVAGGGPVLCQKNNKGPYPSLYLVGLARGVCNEDNQVTLGAISHSMEWIKKELALMNVTKDVYT